MLVSYELLCLNYSNTDIHILFQSVLFLKNEIIVNLTCLHKKEIKNKFLARVELELDDTYLVFHFYDVVPILFGGVIHL